MNVVVALAMSPVAQADRCKGRDGRILVVDSRWTALDGEIQEDHGQVAQDDRCKVQDSRRLVADNR